MLRTLVLVNKLPYPPIGGSALRNWQHMNVLARIGPVGVFCITNDGAQVAADPPPSELDWCEIHRLRRGAEQLSSWERAWRNAWPLRGLGHPRVDRLHSSSAASRLRRRLEAFRPDVVLVCEPWLHRYLRLVQEFGSRVILDAHNIEGNLRSLIPSAAGSRHLRSMARLRTRHIKNIERDFIRRVDQVWVCSGSDAILLRALYGRSADTRVISNGVSTDYYESLPAAETRPTIVFPASFGYRPNDLAAGFLLDEIYPRILEAFENCRLYLVGTGPSPELRRRASRFQHAVVTGEVDDVRPYLAEATVVLVPLRQGGGTRLKILEAFAAKRAVVSTTTGAEGLAVLDGEHLLLRESAADLAAAAICLISDKSLRRRLVASAFSLVTREYSWNAIAPSIESAARSVAGRKGAA